MLAGVFPGIVKQALSIPTYKCDEFYNEASAKRICHNVIVLCDCDTKPALPNDMSY